MKYLSELVDAEKQTIMRALREADETGCFPDYIGVKTQITAHETSQAVFDSIIRGTTKAGIDWEYSNGEITF